MLLKIKRPAVAMIELIFSIVIMGIIMMSAPMLISTASQSSMVALQQEGIHEAVSRVSMVLTYEWDQNNINDSCTPAVLHVSLQGDTELSAVTGTARRIGIPEDGNSRTFKCGILELNASLSIDGKDDIDDFNDTTLVEDTSGSGGKDYIEQTTISIDTSVSYISDSANYNSTEVSFSPDYSTSTTDNTQSTNIKAIQVTVESTSGVDELSKQIKLNAFACNLGGFEYVSREIP